MRRAVVCLLILGLVFGSALSATAGKKDKKKKKNKRVEKVVKAEYQGGGLGVTSPAATGGFCLVDQSLPFHCIDIANPGRKFKFVKVEVKDATGVTTGGFVSQGDTDGDGISDGYGEFCGSHPKPIKLAARGAPLGVSIYNGVCSDASGPSVATTGTIIATFSNKP